MHAEEHNELVDELLKIHQARDAAIELGNAEALTMPVNRDTCRLYRVNCLTYEKEFPRQEAFENVVASINHVRCRLVYYLRGVNGTVEFYMGVVNMGLADDLNTGDYGNMLSRAFKGNFLGSELRELGEDESRELLEGLQKPDMEYSVLLGVPTRNSDREDIAFQGVDRLVNIMTSGRSLGRTFHLMVVWEPVSPEEVVQFEDTVRHAYNFFSSVAKRNIQHSWQKGTQTSDSQTDGKTEGTSEGRSKGESASDNRSTQRTTNSGISSKSTSTTEGYSKGTTTQETWGSSKQTSASRTRTTGQTDGESHSVSYEWQDKFVQDAMTYIKDELQPRIRRGRAKGMYKTAVYVGAETPLARVLLENALISICQGDKPNFIPLYARRLTYNTEQEKVHDRAARSLVSSLTIRDHLPTAAPYLFLDSRPVLRNTVSLATWLTAAEISMLAGLPQKEVPGLELREQVGFGLNIGAPGHDDALELGHMMREGSPLEERRVSLDRRELNKHVFIAGTTGSGKTTTCHRLLASSAANKRPLPFLVVEPAKTEYRALLADPLFADTLVFTVGNERGVPFRFNPFEFLPEESLSGHVDLLKACFMASFDMEAAIPNLLEEGLYRAYEVYGWDFRDDSNRFLKDRKEAWHCGGRYFPTISSYIDIVLKLVDEKGFDERLRNEYKGSIRARLDSLRAGAKGLMLDTPLSVDFMELLDRKVILELEGLKSGEDKSFLMGLVLGRMVEALKIRHAREADFRHITLVEEAHRLLTRPMPGDSPNRKLGVETFSDLLAEVRKYGESLIIVDQIPGKLAPEVLKNTNTKIIHKLFARDDKDVVGDTMALSDKQRAYLSHLAPGEAIMFSQGWKKPVDVQIERLSVGTDDADIPGEEVQKAGWHYWQERPDLFCPGLPRERENRFSRDELLEILRLKDRFWATVASGADWRPLHEKLVALLGPGADSILAAELAARVMPLPNELKEDAENWDSQLSHEIATTLRELAAASDVDRSVLTERVNSLSFI